MKNALTFQMICDVADHVDFRALIRGLGSDLPDVFWFEGERFVTDWTQTAFGGRRQWVLCPSCDRRCAILYRKPASKLWGCRVCMDGRYRSEHLSPKQRRLHKAFKIRRRLGQPDNNTLKPFPEKPAHMHWRTYEAIRAEALQREEEIKREDVERLLGRR